MAVDGSITAGDGTAMGERALADALGLPLYAPPWFVPVLRPMETAHWRVTTCPFHVEPGYHSGLWAVPAMPLLLRRSEGSGDAWETWMSFSPREIESQEPACRHAAGKVAVMGLGLGWAAANLALNPRVRQVTVVELDPEVIELVTSLGVFGQLPEAVRAKVGIVRADALAWRPGSPVDFLYADIWRCFDAPGTLDQVRRMQANAAAETVCFWGQEILLHRLLEGTGWANLPLAGLRDKVRELTGLPLLVPGEGYAETIRRVAANRAGPGRRTGAGTAGPPEP
ncbi:MAG: hypothetical protein KA419_01170 [Acidobacteria bacterium]|nr:hypothetical protein [Acidobacteriota bacterium]